MNNTKLPKILEHTHKKFPNNQAIKCGQHSFNYNQFHERVIKLTNSLLKLGVKYQDKIAIIHKNCHRFLESYFATAYLGAVLVPINYRLLTNDFEYIIKNSTSFILITHPEFKEKVIPLLNRIQKLNYIIWTESVQNLPVNDKNLLYEELIKKSNNKIPNFRNMLLDTPAQIYYTSGTTGKPKGVILTHGNNLIHAQGTIQELKLSVNDRWLHISPMFHLADAWATWAITLSGGQHIILQDFKPTKVLETIEKEKVTLSNFIPTMLNILTNHSDVNIHDFSSLRLIMSGGASIAPAVVKKVIEIFKCDYVQTYGMTETSPFLTMSILHEHLKKLPFEDRLKYMITTGREFTTVELKVINEKGIEVPKNNQDVGEIIVRGKTITPGYWQLPNENESRFKNGWFYTGDLATINAEGYVTIVDRKDDIIITGGENVYSIEVENIIYKHSNVLEAAVIGISDELWGERITCIVVLKTESIDKLTEENLISFCKRYLPSFKVPKKIIFINELPKTGSGKISKKMLRYLFG